MLLHTYEFEKCNQTRFTNELCLQYVVQPQYYECTRLQILKASLVHILAEEDLKIHAYSTKISISNAVHMYHPPSKITLRKNRFYLSMIQGKYVHSNVIVHIALTLILIS